MPNVIEMLRGEHENFSEVLSVLEHQIEIFERAGQPDYDLIRKIIEYFMVFPDVAHHAAEDMISHRLLARDVRTAKLLGNLETEHAHLRDLIGLVDTTVWEVLMEEMRFFAAAERALTASDWSEIEAAVTNPDDPLFGRHVEKKYCDLQNLILQIDRDAA